jgi:hypothetical protein
LNVSNTDSVTHTFNVTIDHNNWPTNAATPIGPVAAQAAQPFTVTVAIPDDASAQTTDTATITVRAQDNAVLKNTAMLTTTVAGVALTPVAAAQIGRIGSTVTYQLTLTNTDNLSDTYHLSLANNVWLTQVYPLSMTLAAQASQPLTVTVVIPLTATPGLTDTVHLTAQGTGVAAFSDLVTTAVGPYAVFLPLAACRREHNGRRKTPLGRVFQVRIATYSPLVASKHPQTGAEISSPTGC